MLCCLPTKTSARPVAAHRRAAAAASKRAQCGADLPDWGFGPHHRAIRTLTVQGAQREYRVHLPEDYPAEGGHPVVLSFHGNGGTSKHQETATQLSESDLRVAGRGIIAVYPQASLGAGRKGDGSDAKASWQGAPYAAADPHDIEFTMKILDDLQDNLCVDTTRIYASGKSNGGGFANLLACTPEATDRIAAFALASPALYSGTRVECNPSRQVPILIAHGTTDGTIPYFGQKFGTKYETPDIDDFAGQWATRNGLDDAKLAITNPFDRTELWTWGEDGAKNRVERLKVDGMDHVWPTLAGLDQKGKVAPFDLTRTTMLPFFEKYTL
ncbi:Alpha/Beta hydrolase protein [Schizophyllum amplum]|uniref:feruloyl esterase n=1 Tax=Schizophyllum amplum TaxID=97359 RepID=A0A550BWL3_9AGAR|nr:Alpha/Beta hydrolase protein [Auriculariopsis ampla]